MSQQTMRATGAINPAELNAVIVRGRKLWGQRSFADFRRIIRPQMIWSWWVERLALELQGFYTRMKRVERPKMAIMAPPQHGKSWTATDFIGWVAGRDPN